MLEERAGDPNHVCTSERRFARAAIGPLSIVDVLVIGTGELLYPPEF
jgi:hypothetical protein